MNALEIDLCSGATDPAMVASAAGSPRVTLRSRITTQPKSDRLRRLRDRFSGVMPSREASVRLSYGNRELPLVSQLCIGA